MKLLLSEPRTHEPEISEGWHLLGFDLKALSFCDASNGFHLYTFKNVFASGPLH